MSKIYKICDDLDLEKACYAALKKVYSVTLFPRILLNLKNDNFIKNFKKKAYFECFLEQKYQFFAKNVHLKCFDIGLFFYQKSKNFYLKIVDGNGLSAGDSVTNIFDFVFQLKGNDLINYTTQINNDYLSLKNKKLLIQNI